MAKQTKKPNLPREKAAVAGAAAIAAGALAAGKVAHDHKQRDRKQRDRKHRRAYRLHDGEAPTVGLPRIARGQIEQARERLRESTAKDLGEAVHEARKHLKRLRALIRVARDGLGNQVYRHENEAFREAGRRLSGARDAKVLVETLGGLIERHGEDLPEGAFGELRSALRRAQESEHELLLRDRETIARVIEDLDAAWARVATWPMGGDGDRDDHDHAAAGLDRIYRRGRKALRAALEDDGDEAFHNLRKRVKDLWYASEVLTPARPKRMRKLAEQAHSLSTIIGDHHDLAVLREAATGKHRAALTDEEVGLLTALIARRQDDLRRRALKRAKRLYSGKPRKVLPR